MTNFPDRDMRQPDYDYSGSFPGNSPMMIIGVVVVVLILGGLWYNFSSSSGVRPQPNQGAIQQMTQPAAPTTSPAIPAPTPKP
ncbi:hypothetical protein [Methylocapsa sp. S129]|uniref:hypothetical protein n=1 Tax=Methylocapsa sp. S129 TaxID=1641869 RepID=UPI00131B3786|nr:hypothetical protein [Methylocapsa sp. S129]